MTYRSRHRLPKPEDPILDLMPDRGRPPSPHPVVFFGIVVALAVLVFGIVRNFTQEEVSYGVEQQTTQSHR